ncbi:hypothetical protein OY671_010230, partial [Metschnikowia pulcherrima]
NGSFPDPAGRGACVERSKGTAKSRPDMKSVISRAWGNAEARSNGSVQSTKGSSAIARRAAKG